MNDVSSSWGGNEDLAYIRNAIDAQRVVMLEIIERQGVHVKRERVISLSLESDSVF